MRELTPLPLKHHFFEIESRNGVAIASKHSGFWNLRRFRTYPQLLKFLDRMQPRHFPSPAMLGWCLARRQSSSKHLSRILQIGNVRVDCQNDVPRPMVLYGETFNLFFAHLLRQLHKLARFSIGSPSEFFIDAQRGLQRRATFLIDGFQRDRVNRSRVKAMLRG
jgi:hypothetical protein